MSFLNNLNKFSNNKLAQGFFIVLTLFFLFTHFIQPINFITADLGRHIKNGEMLLQGHTDLLTKNFYASIHAEHPFINHHWGAGVLFYIFQQNFGFEGLSWFYLILLICISFSFIYVLSRRTNIYWALLLFLVMSPIVADRNEIRPEGISALFFGLYWWILWGFKDKTHVKEWLYALPFFQVIWVNTHIFFIGGWLLTIFFVIDAIINKHEQRQDLYIVSILTILSSMLNPSGLLGVMQPLNIFNGFGYMLAENQNIFFMFKRFGDVKYIHFFILCIFSIISTILFCSFRKCWKENLSLILVLFLMIGVGVGVSRCMAIACLFIVTIGGYFTYQLCEGFCSKRLFFSIATLGCCLFMLIGFFSVVPYWSGHHRIVRIFPKIFEEDASLIHVLRNHQLWTGVMPIMNRSALFFKKYDLEGPIFNNYDIGGYLIYHLFPKERLFVDNRQEAFPPQFFQNKFIPMQQDEMHWHKADEQHGFNVIFFYRHDLTPWGQPFLIKRLNDPHWAPVFVDAFTIIFLKRNAKNDRIINQFELPKDMFGVTKQ